MNEPNTQQEQAAPKKMSSRATNFLMMNAAAGGGYQPEPEQAGDGGSGGHSGPPPAYAAAAEPPPEPPAEQQRRTGVISSTIHPAQRPGNTAQIEAEAQTQSAARTSELKAPSRSRTSQQLSPEEKARRKDENIDRLADRITDVLKKIDDIKTGLLNPDMQTGQKLQLMAKSSPGFAKFMAILLTQLEPMVQLLHRINQKLDEKNVSRRGGRSRMPEAEAPPEDLPPPPPEKVSFLELAEKNIIFCDNRKRPLYTLEQMRGKHGYTASEEVLAPMILENIIEAFHEVAPKAKAIPTPTSGIYANMPMDMVMEQIGSEDIMRFLNYVQRFPRGYVGKNFRITESFAGWVVSGTPDD